MLRLPAIGLFCLVFLAGCSGTSSGQGQATAPNGAILADRAGLRVVLDGACSTPQMPVRIEARVAEQATPEWIEYALRLYRNEMIQTAEKYRCYMPDEGGSTVYYQVKVGGTVTETGSAVTGRHDISLVNRNEMGKAPPADSPFDHYTVWRLGPGQGWEKEQYEEAMRRLDAIMNDDATPADDRVQATYALAQLIDSVVIRARGNGLPLPELPDSTPVFEQASTMGHPLAQYEMALRRGLLHALSAEFVKRSNGNEANLQAVGDAMALDGHLLLSAASGGALQALSTLDAAARAGIRLDGAGVALAELPTGNDIENALNARLRAAASTTDVLLGGSVVLPPNLVIRCDPDWCVVGGFIYIRFSRPDAMSCSGGDGKAICDVTFRIVQRMDIGSLNNPTTDWANSIVSTANKAAPINATIVLAREGQRWTLVGPIETR